MSDRVFPDKKGYTFGQGDSPGLTKRELFAAMAMQGVWSNPTNISDPAFENIAEVAVKQADALMLELAKGEK